MKQPPKYVLDILCALGRAGHSAALAGGCVRDSLLGRRPHDWDVTTSALPEQVLALFPRTVPTGLPHGTVTVLSRGGAVEVTSFRAEGAYSDHRRPDSVAFGCSLEEDLARRDLTVNAMAMDAAGHVTDPFGGRADLARRLIRCVGEPERRFTEDALRMLRAVRFAAQLGFSLEARTAAALASCAPLLERVSGERIRAELEKTLLSPHPSLAALPVELGMLARFGAPARQVELSALAALPATPAHRWGAFCAATGLDIARLPVERALRRAVLHPEDRELAALAVTGRDLYDLGLRGGDIGRARWALLEHVRAHPGDNQREFLLSLAKERT